MEIKFIFYILFLTICGTFTSNWSNDLQNIAYLREEFIEIYLGVLHFGQNSLSAQLSLNITQSLLHESNFNIGARKGSITFRRSLIDSGTLFGEGNFSKSVRISSSIKAYVEPGLDTCFRTKR